MVKEFQAKINTLPLSPGVYLYKNVQGEIIYVGKAMRLRQRVKQYFSKRVSDLKTKALVAEIADLDFIETANELDALLLEAELVKRYQPHYNILLRDDKSAVYIKITLYKAIPDVSIIRLPDDDRALYFGPYYNAYPIRQALRYLRKIFPYFPKPYNPNGRTTLDQQINLSPKVETNFEQKKYRKDLSQIIRFLRGDSLKVVADLEKAMHRFADNQDFEQAAQLRNKLQRLRALQHKVKFNDESIAKNDDGLVAMQQIFNLPKIPQRIEGYDISHLSGTNVVASMVVFVNGISSRPNYRRFKIRVDQNDDFASMREVIARRFRESNVKKWGLPDFILIDGGKGQLAAAIDSLVKTGYSDIPVVGLAKQFEEIIISQGSSIVRVSRQLGVGLRGLGDNFLSLALPRHHPTLRLLQRVRDEAHRFAITYQSKLSRVRTLASQLDSVKGIGPVTRNKIQKSFGGRVDIKSLSFEELSGAVGPAKASLILESINNGGDKSGK